MEAMARACVRARGHPLGTQGLWLELHHRVLLGNPLIALSEIMRGTVHSCLPVMSQ